MPKFQNKQRFSDFFNKLRKQDKSKNKKIHWRTLAEQHKFDKNEINLIKDILHKKLTVSQLKKKHGISENWINLRRDLSVNESLARDNPYVFVARFFKRKKDVIDKKFNVKKLTKKQEKIKRQRLIENNKKELIEWLVENTKLNKKNIEVIYELVNSEKSSKELSKIFGMSKQRISQIKDKAGLKNRINYGRSVITPEMEKSIISLFEKTDLSYVDIALKISKEFGEVSSALISSVARKKGIDSSKRIISRRNKRREEIYDWFKLKRVKVPNKEKIFEKNCPFLTDFSEVKKCWKIYKEFDASFQPSTYAYFRKKSVNLKKQLRFCEKNNLDWRNISNFISMSKDTLNDRIMNIKKLLKNPKYTGLNKLSIFNFEKNLEIYKTKHFAILHEELRKNKFNDIFVFLESNSFTYLKNVFGKKLPNKVMIRIYDKVLGSFKEINNNLKSSVPPATKLTLLVMASNYEVLEEIQKSGLEIQINETNKGIEGLEIPFSFKSN